MNARRERARRRAIGVALPDSIELVVLGVRSGHTPLTAVRSAAAHADPVLTPVFDEFDHRLRRGAALSDALEAFTDLAGPPARSFVDALSTADRYGLPLGPVLDRLVDDAREQRRRHAERAARRLPVTLAFPLVVCTLPSFVLLAVVPAVLGALSALERSLP